MAGNVGDECQQSGMADSDDWFQATRSADSLSSPDPLPPFAPAPVSGPHGDNTSSVGK